MCLFTIVKKQITKFNVLIKPIPNRLIRKGNRTGSEACRQRDKSVNCKTATELQWETTDTRMKPDWLNDSHMTYVVVATECSYLRCLAIPSLIEWNVGQGIYRDISVIKREMVYIASDSLSCQVTKPTKWGLPTWRCRKAMSAGSEYSTWQRSSRSSLSVGEPRTWRRGTAR